MMEEENFGWLGHSLICHNNSIESFIYILWRQSWHCQHSLHCQNYDNILQITSLGDAKNFERNERGNAFHGYFLHRVSDYKSTSDEQH